jgi:hypothetical protein
MHRGHLRFRLGVGCDRECRNGLVDRGSCRFQGQRKVGLGSRREHDSLSRRDFWRQQFWLQRQNRCWGCRRRSWVGNRVLWIVDEEGIGGLFAVAIVVVVLRTRWGDERLWHFHLWL